MPTAIKNVDTFRAERAWGARDIAEINGATVRLHWTDESYKWHVSDGPEVFIVPAGEVDMFFRKDGFEEVIRLGPSDMFVANIGDEHLAHPIGEARILVVERKGSI